MLPIGLEIDTDMPYPPRKTEFSAHFWFVVPFGMVLFAVQLMVDLTDDLRAWKEGSHGSR